MYPAGFATRIVPEGPATAGLEDRFRPHFFGGVATVVGKLLIQCTPDFAMFGEKDYQQLKVVTRLAQDLDLPVKIVGGRRPCASTTASRCPRATPTCPQRARGGADAASRARGLRRARSRAASCSPACSTKAAPRSSARASRSITSKPATPTRCEPSHRSRTARSGCWWPPASARTRLIDNMAVSRGQDRQRRETPHRMTCDDHCRALLRPWTHVAWQRACAPDVASLLHLQRILDVIELGEFRVPQLAVRASRPCECRSAARCRGFRDRSTSSRAGFPSACPSSPRAELSPSVLPPVFFSAS